MTTSWRRIAFAAAVSVTCLCLQAVAGQGDWTASARDRFAAQRFGIFLHWGIYSNYARGEWYLQRNEMRESEYARMVHGFYPSKFDARLWARRFKDAGARYVTLTARHHDGFSMWPSKAGAGYCIADTPYRRDVVGELAEACRDAGLQFNLYYSLMDWHHPNYPIGREWRARSTLKNRNENYALYKKFMMDQLAEILDAYHPGVIWFDGEWDHEAKFSHIAFPIDWELDDLYDLIHSKGALVANNHHMNLRQKEDIQIFEGYLPGSKNDTGLAEAETVAKARPLEQCDTIQTGAWGWKVENSVFRSAEEIVAMAVRAAGIGVNFLLNIGPCADGDFPDETLKTLEGVGEWFAVNGESVYSTTAGEVSTGADIVSTRRGDVLYIHFLNAKAEMAAFRLGGEVVSATALWNGAEVVVERTAGGCVVLHAPNPGGSTRVRVVKVVTRKAR
ncbi:MAG: alpha-L-fucosidase [Kiritimatiellae bacterium]|nr:alpha-L-fucosidase [Kiritimatiellia bacterium]